MLTRKTFLGGALALALSLTGISLSAPNAHAAQENSKKHILVVTVTKTFRHDSIPVAEETIQKLGNDSGAWDTDFVRNDDDMKTKMTVEALKKYDAVVFANTTGVLPLPDPQGFLDYIKAGHGFAAMHAGSDTLHEWPADYEGKDKGMPTPYIQMLGGEFLTHHAQSENSMIIRDPNHPAMKAVAKAGKKADKKAASFTGDIHVNTSPEGKTWRTFDEIYLLKNNDPSKLHVLLDLDKYPADGSPDAGKQEQHIIAWTKMYGEGRVFYTVLGHRQEMWRDPYYQQHILGGLMYVLGLADGSAKPGNTTATTKTIAVK